MKKLLKILPLIACIFMLTSCVEEGPFRYKPKPLNPGVIPVDAYFNTTFSKNIMPDGYMDLKGSVYQLVQNGSGTDAELGFFQIRLACCWSTTSCTKGRSGGSLTDGEGNTLFIICNETSSAGNLTANYPADQDNICGKFEIAGGTGKFEGATGEGTISCQVLSDGDVAAMSHHWTGYVKLAKPY